MDGSISLTVEERKVLLQVYRSGTDGRTARRAHAVLLRADGWTWQQIQTAVFCSTDLVAETMRCFASGVGADIAKTPSVRNGTGSFAKSRHMPFGRTERSSQNYGGGGSQGRSDGGARGLHKRRFGSAEDRGGAVRSLGPILDGLGAGSPQAAIQAIKAALPCYVRSSRDRLRPAIWGSQASKAQQRPT